LEQTNKQTREKEEEKHQQQTTATKRERKNKRGKNNKKKISSLHSTLYKKTNLLSCSIPQIHRVRLSVHRDRTHMVIKNGGDVVYGKPVLDIRDELFREGGLRLCVWGSGC
jgi:hypothetical protein